MRLVATEYLSFDGVFEEPGRWSGPFFSRRLFAEGTAKRALDLTETKRFASGIVILEYRPPRGQIAN